MIWGPIYLALVFGLFVSAMLYFVFFWPSREPEDHAQDPKRSRDAASP